jgi:hypothetical protein
VRVGLMLQLGPSLTQLGRKLQEILFRRARNGGQRRALSC